MPLIKKFLSHRYCPGRSFSSSPVFPALVIAILTHKYGVHITQYTFTRWSILRRVKPAMFHDLIDGNRTVGGIAWAAPSLVVLHHLHIGEPGAGQLSKRHDLPQGDAITPFIAG